jgi:adenylate cyclase
LIDSSIQLAERTSAVLVMDVVESVQQIALNESVWIQRWHDFLNRVEHDLLPRHHGRLVKKLGDGLMVEFTDIRHALDGALAIHALMADCNQGIPEEMHMSLRAGINSTRIYADGWDVYGAGVNLAARLTSLAGPGETIISATARDALVNDSNTTLDDLGDCYLKHMMEPVRAYRVGAGTANSVVPARKDYAAELQPTIMVLPFESRSLQPEVIAVGEMIADSIISYLSRTRHLLVISRHSSNARPLRSQMMHPSQSHLHADYVLSGSFIVFDRRLMIMAELAETHTGTLIWSERLNGEIDDLFLAESKLGFQIAAGAHESVIATEVHRAATQPLQTLRSCTLLLGAITLMHRARRPEFDRARVMLEHLTERHNRHALPSAWMAVWYVLRVAQGWADQPERDANAALVCCDQALAKDSQSAFAIAVTGQVQGYLKKDLATAERLYQQALACNPNESLAWLWLGMNAGFRGESEEALEATSRALTLSSLDPLRYYFESLAASAAVTAGQYQRGIELARSSLRRNSAHSSTYRALAIGQALSGQVEQARTTVAALLRLEPSFTISQFIQRMPGARSSPEHAEKLARALRAAGLPE